MSKRRSFGRLSFGCEKTEKETERERERGGEEKLSKYSSRPNHDEILYYVTGVRIIDKRQYTARGMS